MPEPIRDPEAVFRALRVALNKWPMLRVGQYIENLQLNAPSRKGADLFNIEDNDLVVAIYDDLNKDRGPCTRVNGVCTHCGDSG